MRIFKRFECYGVIVMSRVSEVEDWRFDALFVYFFTGIKIGKTCLKKKECP